MNINNSSVSMQNLNANANINAIRQKWQEQLGTGSSINRSSDDPTGLALSEGLRNQIAAVMQSRNNTLDSLSYYNTQDASLNEVSNNLTSMQQYAAQLENPLLSDRDKANIQTQMDSLTKNIGNILDNSKMNGINLFSEESVGKDLWDGLKSLSGSSSLSDIQGLADGVSSMRGEIGAQAVAAESSARNIADQLSNLVDTESRIRDTNMAEAYVNWSNANILSNSSNAMLSHSMMTAQNVMQLLG